MAISIKSPEPEIFYPESDGKPMAENTRQFDWIVTIKCGLEALFKDNPAVFVAGDLLWYPVEGDNKTRQAPDAMVAFGRPKGPRGSYLQWLEGGIAPQVVFEVLSPGNRAGEMEQKRQFYVRYGVEEYYEYDPDRATLKGWQRDRQVFVPIPQMHGWISPRLRVRFDLEGEDLVLTDFNGHRLESYLAIAEAREQAEVRADFAEARAGFAEERASSAEERASSAEIQAGQEREARERERQAREQVEAELERLKALLRERGLSEEG